MNRRTCLSDHEWRELKKVGRENGVISTPLQATRTFLSGVLLSVRRIDVQLRAGLRVCLLLLVEGAGSGCAAPPPVTDDYRSLQDIRFADEVNGTAVTDSGDRNIHVSPAGNDRNPGSRAQPVATLEAARDILRRRDAVKGATVWLHEGRYRRTTSFVLQQEDSGSPSGPVIYRSLPGARVVFDGGILVSPNAFGQVRDEALRERLLPGARDQIVQLDLRALGVTNYGAFGPRGFARPTFPTPPELFIDGQPQPIARWPNPGEDWIPLGEVLDQGSVPRIGDTSNRPGVFRTGTTRAERWRQATDLHLTGFFAWGYAEDTVRIARIDPDAQTFTTVQPHLYGYGGGRQPTLWKWYAINLLEEIDLPGEYFIDRETGTLYSYPPKELAGSRIQLSLLDGPFISTDGASYVRFEGLVFENARSDGIRMVNATSNLVAGCTLRNLGGRGVLMRGMGNTVLSCDVYGTGSGGVSIGGGDRKTLTSAGNVVRNCDIHHLNRWYRNYQPCVGVSGVGNRVEHNHLHHCPGQAVVLSGNDHVFEFNEMDHVIGEMSDQGAVYMGRNPSQTGNLFRYNFFHHTASTHEKSYGNSGIFFDDGDSGQRVIGNVFYQTGANGAVKYHGGQYNEFINNIVVDCKLTVKYQLWNQERWDKFLAEESMQRKLLKEVNILEPPYTTRYPKLARIFLAPYTRASHVEERNLVTSAGDQVFADGAKLDFRIRSVSAVQSRVPGFEPVPFDRIGLQVDDYRPQIPNNPRATDSANPKN